VLDTYMLPIDPSRETHAPSRFVVRSDGTGLVGLRRDLFFRYRATRSTSRTARSGHPRVPGAL